MTPSFKNWSMFTENLALLNYCLCSNWWERVARSPREKKFEFLVNLDYFSKYLKYLRNFEKRSKLTKNSDFFARGERTTLSHQFDQRQYFNRAKFSVNILQFLKDVVISVGVSFRLCSSFSVDSQSWINIFKLLVLRKRPALCQHCKLEPSLIK